MNYWFIISFSLFVAVLGVVCVTSLVWPQKIQRIAIVTNGWGIARKMPFLARYAQSRECLWHIRMVAVMILAAGLFALYCFVKNTTR